MLFTWSLMGLDGPNRLFAHLDVSVYLWLKLSPAGPRDYSLSEGRNVLPIQPSLFQYPFNCLLYFSRKHSKNKTLCATCEAFCQDSRQRNHYSSIDRRCTINHLLTPLLCLRQPPDITFRGFVKYFLKNHIFVQFCWV